MVEKGRDKTGDAGCNRVKEPDGGQRSDGGAYTPQDASHFESLNDAVRASAGPLRLGQASVDQAPQSSAFDYTESDDLAFDRLMQDLGGSRNRHQGQTASQRLAGQGFGYTEQDDKAFSELASAERFPANAADVTTGPATISSGGESAFQFTDQDDQAFRKIMTGTPLAPEHDDTANFDRPSREDRDVGPIRIVDFDKENARARESAGRGNTNIKVRYFD